MSARSAAAARAALDTPPWGEFAPPESYLDEGSPPAPIRKAAARKLSGINFSEMKPHLTDGYLVKGLLGRGILASIHGPSGEGKTFFATDLALHIAAQARWRNHQVAGGLVAYVALEGASSAENRFCAARQARGITTGLPLKLTPGPINLRDPAEVSMLIDFVRETETEHGTSAAAIFIDTLSRAMAGGDENGPEDMGELIKGADAVRLVTAATVVLVHHTGKDLTRGARGHSSLKAALDCEIEVVKTGSVHLATVTKQRDLPSGARYAFALEVVELGRDSDGDAVTTCIVRPADEPAAIRKVPGGKHQGALCAALTEWQRAHDGNDLISSIEFRHLAKTQGIQPKRLPEIADSLTKCGWLGQAIGGYRIFPESST